MGVVSALSWQLQSHIFIAPASFAQQDQQLYMSVYVFEQSDNNLIIRV